VIFIITSVLSLQSRSIGCARECIMWDTYVYFACCLSGSFDGSDNCQWLLIFFAARNELGVTDFHPAQMI
jgi:hypothetical protein